MNRPGLFITVLVSLTLLHLACDDEPKPVVEEKPATEPAKPQPASKPTTQSIISLKRQLLTLQVIPFKIEAPENWKIVTHEAPSVGKSITMLEGPIIDSDLVAQFSGPIHLSAQQVKLLRDKAEKEAVALRANGGDCIIRESGNMIVIDKRKMPVNTTTLPMDLPPSVDWRMFLLVPAGIGYEQYEINCFDLSPEAYQKNQKFLTEIFSSARYDDAMPTVPIR